MRITDTEYILDFTKFYEELTTGMLRPLKDDEYWYRYDLKWAEDSLLSIRNHLDYQAVLLPNWTEVKSGGNNH